VQAEVVVGLGLVMLAATLVVAGALFRVQESRLRELLGQALRVEARSLPPPELAFVRGTRWWRLRPGEAPGAAARERPDAETRALAEAALRAGAALVRPGAPWEPIRFAVPTGAAGEVAVARLPAEASLRLRALPLALVAALLAADVALFTAFGLSLLRARVVLPLRRLAEAARGLAEGEEGAQVPLEGPREAVEVASAFNDMSAALARRAHALEKAVADLRAANADLRRARAGLDRAERLAAVGRLAAGVAHEVGNPIGALLAFLDLAQREPSLPPATRAHLERATAQGARVRTILRQLLEFSRPAQRTRVRLDLALLAEEAVALVRAQRRWEAVRFEVTQSGEPPPARGDPGAVVQILLNLVMNAADAARAAHGGQGGRVALCVRPAALDVRPGEPRHAAAARSAPDGVECVVADDGVGIAPEDRERVFDPFFTTKPPGEGTGLGLSNSLRLAEEQEGSLELVAPPEGLRTAFALRLPAAAAAAARGPASGCAVRSGLRASDGDEDRTPRGKN
jgi:signal transduction histidine kinase